MADDKIKAREELEAELKEVTHQANLLRSTIDKQEDHPRDIEKIKKKIEDMNEYIFLNDRKTKLEFSLYKIKAQEEYEVFYHEVLNKLENDIEVTSDDISKLLILKGKSLDSKGDEEVSKIFNEAKGEDDKEAVDKYLQYITNAPKLSELLDLIKEQQEKKHYTYANLSDIQKIGQTTIAETVMHSRDKITNKIVNGQIIPDGEDYTVVTEKGAKSWCIVKMVNTNTVAVASQFLSRYDMAVHNAIANLYQAGNRYVTYQTIYRQMGKKDARITPTARNQMKISLLKLSTTLLYIDPSQETNIYSSLAGYKPQYRNMLYIEQDVEVNHNNEITNNWIRILSMPILFQYAMDKKYVNKIDLKVLDTPVNNSQENIALIYYLVDRIERMRGTSKLSRNIKIDTAIEASTDFSSCNSEQSRKNKKSRRFNAILKILDYWKDINYIKDYNINLSNNDKREIQSITIILTNVNKSIG